MNPQGSEHLPSLDLPKPQTEQFAQGLESLPSATAQETANTVALERDVQGQAAVPVVANPAASSLAAPQHPLQSTPVPPVMPSAAATPAIADDVDLIEKEWVEKAKQIVAQTRHDPYLQNREMNRMKADYMKKRYGKDIKLEE